MIVPSAKLASCVEIVLAPSVMVAVMVSPSTPSQLACSLTSTIRLILSDVEDVTSGALDSKLGTNKLRIDLSGHFILDSLSCT